MIRTEPLKPLCAKAGKRNENQYSKLRRKGQRSARKVEELREKSDGSPTKREIPKVCCCEWRQMWRGLAISYLALTPTF